MIIQVPEHFSKSKDILTLENLSFLYYFNRNKTDKIHVQLNKHMLLHVFNGSKIIVNNGTTHKVTNKQSVFLSKGQYFMSEILSIEKSHFDGMMVFFDDSFLFSIFHKYESLRQGSNSKQLLHMDTLCILEDSQALHETMVSTKSYLDRKSDDEALIQLKFEEIFLQLLQTNHSHEIVHYFQALYASGLYKLRDLFENNTFTTVEEMIKESNLSEVQFRKVFKEMYDVTPKEWLLHKSLKKAKQLLETKEFNVTEVCYECGFHSISWFIQSFKKEFSVTPKKYQQNC